MTIHDMKHSYHWYDKKGSVGVFETMIHSSPRNSKKQNWERPLLEKITNFRWKKIQYEIYPHA